MVGREMDKPPYRHFEVAVAMKLQGTYHVEDTFKKQWHAAVLVYSILNGALQRCHSLNHDIAGLQNALQKSRPLHFDKWRHCVWIVQWSRKGGGGGASGLSNTYRGGPGPPGVAM